jgi:hypothetical protein
MKKTTMTTSMPLSFFFVCYEKDANGIVATLALGSRPRQGFARLQAKKEARESHFMLPRVQKSVRE